MSVTHRRRRPEDSLGIEGKPRPRAPANPNHTQLFGPCVHSGAPNAEQPRQSRRINELRHLGEPARRLVVQVGKPLGYGLHMITPLVRWPPSATDRSGFAHALFTLDGSAIPHRPNTAPVYETEGHRFESCRARFKLPASERLLRPDLDAQPFRWFQCGSVLAGMGP
jgi:hypothetical protein